MRILVICNRHQLLFGNQIGNEMGGRVARMERDEVHTEFTSVTLC